MAGQNANLLLSGHILITLTFGTCKALLAKLYAPGLEMIYMGCRCDCAHGEGCHTV